VPDPDIDHAKDRLSARVWETLDSCEAGRSGPVYGKIPNFTGAERAAEHLAADERWHRARVVKANPDKAQAEVRRSALLAGHLLYMAVPKLATPRPFYELDPARLTAPYDRVVTGKGAAEQAPRVGVQDMPPVDVGVCGSGAVNRDGARIGKGAGYSDLEVALLTEAGLISADTLIVTTVHTLQVLDEELPESGHDFRVDLIATPDEIIECPGPRRATGLVWDDLSPDKIAEIPVLQQLHKSRRSAPGR
jgi:5-formyltetrahydrofolate cyclo-ligase